MKSSISTLFQAAAISAGLFIANSAPAATASPNQTTVVLVHGAFADGSAWDKVVPLLQAKGLHVVSVQNPLTSLADDVAATRRVLDVQTGPVVLVGHSWGGMVITEAGQDERVKALVYVAAFAPSEGESATDLTKDYPTPEGLQSLVADKQGFVSMSPERMAKYFAQDVPAAQTRIMAATQGAIRGQNFVEKVTVAAWKTKPSWYVLGEQDHMIQPALQKVMAAKISAHVVSLPSSHVPQLSRPTQVANAILAAAAAQSN